MSSSSDLLGRSLNWRTRWALRRNRILGSRRFQEWAARIPLFQSIAKRKASGQFDLIAGFVYTQITYIYVSSRLISFLAEGPKKGAQIAGFLGFSLEATDRILRAGRALKLSEEPEPGLWLLGEVGAALSVNDGALAMIEHHPLLYRDLADPVALLESEDRSDTELSRFWHYAASPHSKASDSAPYSALMRATQPMVWQQIFGRYPFARHSRMLDIGGGSGAFAEQVAAANPELEIGIFDLPEVMPIAQERFSGNPTLERIAYHPGSFKKDPIPPDYDLITLVRILHDHDDEVAESLLGKVHDSLPKGGRLLIVEPMAQTPLAERMGDAYFGMYLWTMGSGRPRTHQEIHKMLKKAGFSSSREISTSLQIVARAIVATH